MSGTTVLQSRQIFPWIVRAWQPRYVDPLVPLPMTSLHGSDKGSWAANPFLDASANWESDTFLTLDGCRRSSCTKASNKYFWAAFRAVCDCNFNKCSCVWAWSTFIT
eukprot:CAMPEP_0115732444 /NCGR_PEP_ID=MMETSP0272-20121206/85123_1 /TAXON_ID=71861 /ORGANISM="Scrippsiella trochoidea, Strain CCMP3099" /LENGTH=106 /DNA_ID=CAMNT_0003176351 /DNA_START=346 /DNA_END=662 /DNA_ORIENTATION=+